ncbi:Glycosyl transferases group 1 [Rosistilla oblonga]|nr:Glycosyl transferases group 1 [Rosistilla oblonga]
MHRMCQQLQARGHHVTIILGEGGELMEQLSNCATILLLGSRNYHKLAFPFTAIPAEVTKTLLTSDAIVAFSETSLSISYCLLRRLRLKKRLLAGVFNPWAYHAPPTKNHASNVFCNILPDENKLFMSEHIRLSHAKTHDLNQPVGKTWPLPLDVERYRRIERKPERLRILSVGRLMSFKTYNLYMIDILKRLKSEGVHAHWEVVGDVDKSDNELKSEMCKRIELSGLRDNVTLHGTLDEHRIIELLQTAGVFVGMGTSLIVAAAAGVPAIPAIVNDLSSSTYGWFHELPPGSCGEHVEGTSPDISIHKMLSGVLAVSDTEYSNLCFQEKEAAMFFDINRRTEQFLELTNQAKLAPLNHKQWAAYLLKKLAKKSRLDVVRRLS